MLSLVLYKHKMLHCGAAGSGTTSQPHGTGFEPELSYCLCMVSRVLHAESPVSFNLPKTCQKVDFGSTKLPQGMRVRLTPNVSRIGSGYTRIKWSMNE